MGIKSLRNSLKISILDKELGSSILFLRYTKDNYFWRKATLVNRRSDCVIWCISKIYLRCLRSQQAWKQFLKMLQFRALGYMLIQMYYSGVSWKKSYHHISQLSYADPMMQDGSEVQTHFPSLQQRVRLSVSFSISKAPVYFPIPSNNQTIQRNKISLGRRQTDSQMKAIHDEANKDRIYVQDPMAVHMSIQATANH